MVAELKSIDRQNLSSVVKENLKLYFTKSGLKAGDPVPTELELANRLNVSRTAVREALKSLEALGIIEVRPGIGRFLKPFNFDAILENLSYGIDMDRNDFADILDVRISLESVFLERYTGHYSEAQIRQLRDILDAMRRLNADGGGEASMIQLHTLFHLSLYRDQGNALLLSLIKIFATVQRSLTLMNRYRTQDMADFVSLHEALVNAIEEKNPAKVKQKLLEHFKEALAWSGARKEPGGSSSLPMGIDLPS
ncbi:MAG: FCD domain-containing protein [Spirochaetota bacterium]